MKQRTLPAAPTWAVAVLLLSSPAPAAQLAAGARGSDPAPALPDTAPGLAWADVDADGFDDVLAAAPSGGVVLWRNLGDGGFEDATERFGLAELSGVRGAAFGDFDGDGFADLYVAGAEGAGRLLQNATGVFVDVTDVSGLHGLAGSNDAFWSDYDRDGFLDLLLPGDETTVLCHNLGGSSFEPTEISGAGSGLAAPEAFGGARASGATAGSAATAAAETDRVSPAVPSSGGGSGLDGSGPGGVAGASASHESSPAEPEASSALCVPMLADQAGGGCLMASSAPQLGLLYPISEELFVGPTGRVGIGTTNPARLLELSSEGQAVMRMHTQNASSGSVIELRNTSATQSLIGGINFLGPDGTNGQLLYGSDDSMRFVVDDDESLRVLSDGRVSVNQTTTLYGKLSVREPNGGLTSAALFASADGGPAGFFDGPVHTGFIEDTFGFLVTRAQMSRDPATGAGRVLVFNDSGVESVKLGVDSTEHGFVRLRNADHAETVLLDNDGAGNGYLRLDRSDGADKLWLYSDYAGTGNSRVVTDVLEIRGGADLVEGFDTGDEECEPGSVVVIDPESPGELALAREAYDPRVAGVVSGAGGVRPGLHMGQDGALSGDTPVALTGRVYVKGSAENGAIRAGDLLTTSDTPGHAMRADDVERSFGAVIGKAMTPLDEGTGLVLVLVNLQ